jgi:predicted AAA+ superfamily ATPase
MTDYPRWQEQYLKQALETRRIVMLTGARQCGKTTLARKLASDQAIYRTLDDRTARQAATDDPHLFVQYAPDNGMLIIDEVQKVPDLLPAIKKIVDQDNRPGQFLITGSANILSLPTVQESMAGRIGKVRLRPLSQGEILQTKPDFLKRAFEQKFAVGKNCFNRDALVDIIFRGGFPEAVRLEGRARKNWHVDYIDALIVHDLNDYRSIRQVDVMKDLVHILAAWSTKYMDVTAISSGLSVDRRTLANYIGALEAFYIVETIPPWRKTDYDRVGKLDKLVMADTGMMAALLGWKSDDLIDNADKAGKIFETFAYNELMSQIDAAEEEYTIYQYRDREKREIDFLIEREDHSLLAIEIKSGMTVKKSDFKHIRWFRDNLAKNRHVLGIVLYAGEEVIPFGENFWAIPFGYMWL